MKIGDVITLFVNTLTGLVEWTRDADGKFHFPRKPETVTLPAFPVDRHWIQNSGRWHFEVPNNVPEGYPGNWQPNNRPSTAAGEWRSVRGHFSTPSAGD